MTRARKVALGIVSAIAGLILIVVVIGYSLPRDHVASRELVLQAAPSAVYEIIATPALYPTWRSNVDRVDLLPDSGGKVRFREVSGSDAITFDVEEQAAPTRFVTRISDAGLPFGGSWVFELAPEGAATRLRITENGEVYNPVFRFVSRFVMGQHATIDRYFADLQRKVETGR